MKLLLSLVMTTLLSGLAFTAEANDDADRVAKAFYESVIALRIAGLPDQAELLVIGEFLSAEINERIPYGWQEREKLERENAGQGFKPPWVKEGEPVWKSFGRNDQLRTWLFCRQCKRLVIYSIDSPRDPPVANNIEHKTGTEVPD